MDSCAVDWTWNLAVCLFAALFASAVCGGNPFFERMSSKAAYVRPIQDLSVVAGRVSEQVCGRVVHHFTETFKRGSSKDCGRHCGWPVA